MQCCKSRIGRKRSLNSLANYYNKLEFVYIRNKAAKALTARFNDNRRKHSVKIQIIIVIIIKNNKQKCILFTANT